MAMASLSFPSLILILTLWISLTSPASSLTCSSEKLPDSKKTFANCTDLPVLDSTLHYTYNASNSSLSVAFVAAPESPEGWTAWAINPTGTGMLGAQSLIAFKSNGSLVVKKYNISSYSMISETDKLAFDVWDLSAVSGSGGKYVIYASIKVPASAEKLNQVWQVGANVTDGHPMRHALAPVNKQSSGDLELSGKASAASPTGTPAAATPVLSPSSGTSDGQRMVTNLLFGGFALIATSILT